MICMSSSVVFDLLPRLTAGLILCVLFTFHTMIKLLAATTVGIAGLLAITPAADARPGMGCYPYLAQRIMSEIKRGGGTPNQAVQAAYNEGYFDGSELCAIRIGGVIDRHGL